MKTVIEMAREAGLVGGPVYARGLERFAELVRADEREACAKVLDEMAEDMEREMEPSTAIAYVRSKAATIRARGETK
jgi:inosine/xanthosine triphosphate pyrophosphatase family protein